ncbi:MAG: hypothetical protein GEU74_07995 [Nitriliruptorales bacterium]|nr:hypothetical protein [Nitriliruptorales bacterium]
MTNDNDNVERMRRGYDAFSTGDLDTLRELFSPDIVWHAGGDNPLTGDYKGTDEVFGFFGKLLELSAGTLSQEVHDLLANDTHGVALTHVKAQRPDGRALDQNQVAVFHIDGGGRVTEAWTLPSDAAAADAFFA